MLLEQLHGFGDLLLDPVEVQAPQKDPAAGFFRHGLERIMLVRVLRDFEHPGGEARLQLPQVLLDVAADHEDRGGNLKFLVKFRDLR